MNCRFLASLLILSSAAVHAAEPPLFELHESVRNPGQQTDWRTDTVDFGRPALNRAALLQDRRAVGRKPMAAGSADAIAAHAPAHRDGRVLVEIQFNASSRRAQRNALRGFGAEIHTDITENFVEAWVAPKRIKALQQALGTASIRPARLVRPTRTRVGSVTSEGVAESGADIYQSYGADGDGQIITVIDTGFQGFASMQTPPGDWPANSDLQRFELSGSTVIDCSASACPTFEDDDHGTNVTAIAFDTAPGATFRVYKVATLGEWYEAILHASDATAHPDGRSADIIVAALTVPLDGIGDGSECPPNRPAPCGSIAEAAAIAQSRGSLVVNAAGNNREEHWGGLYSPTSPGLLGYQDALAFGGGNLNVSPFCLSDGSPIQMEMFWDDWTDVDHDYDLFLLRRTPGNGWSIVASSTAFQDGNTATQNPQEFLAFTASGSSAGCTSGSNYAALVLRFDAPTNRNIQLFSNIGFGINVAERSLGFPSDSPAVFAVGALDLGISNATQASFSSEGPVLAPGGGLPGGATQPSVAKPDGMSFSPVSTAVGGVTSFGGTSSAAPHVAGLAALLNQVREDKTIIANSNGALAMREGLEWLGSFGGNDLGTAGHDPVFGYGRMRLFECEQTFQVQAQEFQMITPACQRLQNNTIEELFSDSNLGTFRTDWGLWERIPATDSYRLMNATDTLDPEKGYWYFGLGSGTLVANGLLADITEALSVETVGDGGSGLGKQHMLGNPRPIDLNWSDVRFFYDGTSQDLQTAVNDGKVRPIAWSWNKVTEQYDVFDGLLDEGVFAPGEGFWIRTIDDVIAQIPTPAEIEANQATRAPVRAPTRGAAAGWQIDLSMSLGRLRNDIRFGQHADASEGFDRLDAESLASFGARSIDLTIESAASRSIGTPLLRDFRPVSDQSSWTFEVSVLKNAIYTIRWTGDPAALNGGVLILPDGTEVPGFRRGGSVDVALDIGTHRFGWSYRRPVETRKP